jgi:hypothetical protein
VELAQLLNAGGVAGLAVGFINGLIDSMWLSRILSTVANNHDESNRARYPLQILMYLLGGIGIGLLFWMSWGLAALVRIDWWERGLVFAAALWAVCCIPFGAQLYLTNRLSARIAAVTVLQHGYSLCVISLACAWTYAKS